MPRGAVDSKHFFTFVKGLITEATGITYPENSMVDGDNINVNTSGLASRRKGLDFEELFALSASTMTPDERNYYAITFHEWKSVNGQGNVNFWMLQIGTVLHFGRLSEAVLSQNYMGNVDLIDLRYRYYPALGGPALSEDLVINKTEVPFYPLDVSYGKGRLYCNSMYITPFYIEFDEELDSVKVVAITIEERDYEGLNDGLGVTEQPDITINPPEHTYNLRNQGWVDNANITSSLRDFFGIEDNIVDNTDSPYDWNIR